MEKWYKKKQNVYLLVILFVAVAFRFYRLDYQSFWLDELHSMRQTDPANSTWKDMFQFLSWDQHPPLFYILERCFLTVFKTGDHPELIARLLPAAIGVLSVWAVYLLGKELLDANLGLIAAAVTCVNLYNIEYSQEVRDYILVFLTATLSFVFFIRLIRSPKFGNCLLYAFFASMTVYSHYYGIFIVCSQFFVALLLIITERDRLVYLKYFALAGALIAILYLPWLPYLKTMANMKSFWNPPVAGDFFVDYFKGYFGTGSDLLIATVDILLAFVLIKVVLSRRTFRADYKNDPALLCFILMISAILFVFVLPYIRSRVTFSMLYPRYTIVILPLLLVAIAYGIVLIPSNRIRMVVLAFFVIISGKNLVFNNRFYSHVQKTQFREATQSATLVKDSKFPIFCDGVDWQEEYYIQKSGYAGPLKGDPLTTSIDGILHQKGDSSQPRGFWILGIHGPANILDSVRQARLDSQYVKVKEVVYFDAFVQQYVKKDSSTTQ